MEEIILVTSSSTGVIQPLDLYGNPICPAFKNSVSDCNQGLTLTGGGHSGSSNNDYIITCQSKKPLLHVYTWNKPQILMEIQGIYLDQKVSYT